MKFKQVLTESKISDFDDKMEKRLRKKSGLKKGQVNIFPETEFQVERGNLKEKYVRKYIQDAIKEMGVVKDIEKFAEYIMKKHPAITRKQVMNYLRSGGLHPGTTPNKYSITSIYKQDYKDGKRTTPEFRRFADEDE